MIRANRILPLTALALLMLGFWAVVWQRMAPVQSGEPRVSQLPCVSYAPFRKPGEGPRAGGPGVSRDRVLEDLRIVRRISPCVRTYGVDQGLQWVPEVARELGLQVILGAWVDRDAQATERQLQTALALSHEFADVVQALIVGNEVLLRGELPAAQLAQLLQRARAQAAVPVSYADVWEFWLRHQAALREHVDFATVHVLPYWEDQPIAIEVAPAHVQAVARHVEQELGPLPIFVGEVGWPAQGRQRGSAVPSASGQAQLAHELLEHKASKGLPRPWPSAPAFNWIEAFDQPWKRELEGAMGGYWGVFESDGRQRLMLAEPVADPSMDLPGTGGSSSRRPDLLAGVLGLAAIGFAVGVFAVVGFSMSGLRQRFARQRRGGVGQGLRLGQGLRQAVGNGVALAAVLAALPLQWQWLEVWCRDTSEWMGGIGMSALLLWAAWVLRPGGIEPRSAPMPHQSQGDEDLSARPTVPETAAMPAMPAKPEIAAGASGPSTAGMDEALLRNGRVRDGHFSEGRFSDQRLTGELFATALLAAALLLIALLLVQHARYRPLLWPLPWVIVWVLAWNAARNESLATAGVMMRRGRRNLAALMRASKQPACVMAALVTAMSVAAALLSALVVYSEGPHNTEAWGLLVMQGLWLWVWLERRGQSS